MRTPPATAIPEREGTTFSRAASLILDDAGAGSAPADAPAKPIKRAIYTEQAPIPSALPSQGSHRPLAGTPFPDAVLSAESTPEASVDGNVIQAQAADNRAESVYEIAQASEAVSPSASAAVSVPVSRKKRALYSTESCPTPRSSPTVSDDFSGPSSHPTTDPPARPVLDSAPLQAIEGEQNPATVRDVPIATPAPAQRKKRAVYTQSASLESTPKPSATFATVQPAPASQVARNSAYAAASKSATMPSVSTSPPQARLAFDRASSIGSSSSAPISAPVPAKRVKRAIYTQSPSVHSSPLPSPGLSSVAPTAGSRVQQGRAHAHTSSATVDHGGREDQSPPLDRSATDASWSDVNGFSARMRYDTDQRPSSSVVDRARDGYNASRRQEGQRGNAARRGDGSDDSSTWTDVATGRRSFGSPDPGQSRNYTKAGSRTERAPAFSLGATVKLEPIDATVSWVETSRISRQPSWQNIPYPKKCKRSVYLSRPPDPATLDVQHLYSESAAAVNSTKPTYNVKGGEIDLDEGSSHKEDLMAAAWSAGYDRRFWEDPQYAHAETKVMVQRDGYNFEYYLGEGVSLATRLLLRSDGIRPLPSPEHAFYIILPLPPGHTAKTDTDIALLQLVQKRRMGAILSAEWVDSCFEAGKMLPIHGWEVRSGR